MNNEVFDFVRVEKNYIYTKKTIKGGINTLEATPHVWAMSLVHIKNGSVTIKTGHGERIFPTGLYGSFLPPFSFIEYHGRFELMEMTTLSSPFVVPSLPAQPIVFPIDSLAWFPTLRGASDWLRESIESRENHPVEIGRGRNPSSVSLRVKHSIDRSYAHPLKFSELAERLHLSQALMTMHFKKSFFLPPVKYRNCLRLIDALMRLAKAHQRGTRVIDIAQEVGFNDLSQFNRQFKAYFGATPRTFLS